MHLLRNYNAPEIETWCIAAVQYEYLFMMIFKTDFLLIYSDIKQNEGSCCCNNSDND